jgi:hypothetical protein
LKDALDRIKKDVQFKLKFFKYNNFYNLTLGFEVFFFMGGGGLLKELSLLILGISEARIAVCESFVAVI